MDLSILLLRLLLLADLLLDDRTVEEVAVFLADENLLLFEDDVEEVLMLVDESCLRGILEGELRASVLEVLSKEVEVAELSAVINLFPPPPGISNFLLGFSLTPGLVGL